MVVAVAPTAAAAPPTAVMGTLKTAVHMVVAKMMDTVSKVNNALFYRPKKETAKESKIIYKYAFKDSKVLRFSLSLGR